MNQPIQLGRHAFFGKGALVLASASLGPATLIAEDKEPSLRIGLVTDLHYADKAPAGTRHYRETLDKLDEAARQFGELKPNFLVVEGSGETNNGYSVMELESNGTIRLTGFRKQKSHTWPVARTHKAPA